jgi:hypothetical protein
VHQAALPLGTGVGARARVPTGDLVLLATGPSQLVPEPRGSIDNLIPRPLPEAPAADGTLVVDVKAVGVNFRDVLNILGMYPGDAGAPGSDCAGPHLSILHEFEKSKKKWQRSKGAEGASFSGRRFLVEATTV